MEASSWRVSVLHPFRILRRRLTVCKGVNAVGLLNDAMLRDFGFEVAGVLACLGNDFDNLRAARAADPPDPAVLRDLDIAAGYSAYLLTEILRRWGKLAFTFSDLARLAPGDVLGVANPPAWVNENSPLVEAIVAGQAAWKRNQPAEITQLVADVFALAEAESE